MMLILLCVLCAGGDLYAQSKKQKELEERRQALRLELKQLSRLRESNKREEISVLQQAQDLDTQIKKREQLIAVTNRQANGLSREIDDNINKITNLRDELEDLKKDYSEMIQRSYKSNDGQSKVMFLLSSESFKQAYKRVQYMKQYANYRKQQGEQIKERTADLQRINKTLIAQRKQKENLIAENREAKKQLDSEKKQQEALIATIRSKESKYASQIKKKQQEADRIDKQIDKLIKEAIAARNAKRKKASVKTTTTSTKKGTFALTPEEALIAKSFAGNKGKHIWPVERGTVIRGYGSARHPQLPNVTTYSSGVDIETAKGALARAIYEGEVLRIQEIPGQNNAVYVLHGDYITIYQNLINLKVQQGDKISRKQNLGTIAVNAFTGKTVIRFSVRRNSDKLNPSSWVSRLQ